MSEPQPHALQRAMRCALIVGGAALLLAMLAGVLLPGAFFHGYLFAFVFVWGLPLGAAALLMLHHLTGGRWGWSIRASLEAALLTLPLIAVLFLPVLVGMMWLYPWSLSAEVQASELLQRKAAYLNVPFFIGRAVLYFAIWLAGGTLLWRWSSRDRPNESTTERTAHRLAALSAAGLILYVLTVSFAAIDWVGSLEPEWFSSIFGLYLLVGQALTALALASFVVVAVVPRDAQARLPMDVQHDLGNLLLALVVLHAYLGYSQFFIIWMGNLPHEVLWYVPRTRGGWGVLSVVLVGVHFALPFVALLFRHVKRTRGALLAVAGLILLGRLIDTAWMVMPSDRDTPLLTVMLGLLALVGVGGVWAGVFLWQCDRRSIALRPIEPTVHAAPAAEREAGQ